MPAKNDDLHGNVPDEAPLVLPLIDVINDLEFDGGAALLTQALPMAERLALLKQRARAAGIPAIYVNDNFGRWRSDLAAQLAHCLRDGVRGRPLFERLIPEPDDYFVLKPKHSGFFSTTLDTLLTYLRARTLISPDRPARLRRLDRFPPHRAGPRPHGLERPVPGRPGGVTPLGVSRAATAPGR